jgi:hypothetical protein
MMLTGSAGYITELTGWCDHWEFNITEKLCNSNSRGSGHADCVVKADRVGSAVEAGN